MREAEVARKAEVAAVITEIKAGMAEMGITLADLGGRGRVDKGRTVAAKYRKPQTGETWTGRGKKPKWLAAQIEQGKTIESFLI